MMDNQPDLSWFKFHIKRSSKLISQIASGGDAKLNPLDIADLATGGSIGTAVATVDTYNKFNINQTTASQTITIPNPTLITEEKLIYVENVGSKSFSLYGTDLKPLSVRILVFNGTAWITAGGGGGGANLNPLDIADLSTGGSIGTAIATVDIYNKFNVNQITADQTITIPNPTLTTQEKLIYVENVGSESFSLYGTDVKPLSVRILVFNGTAWITAGGSEDDNKADKILNTLAIADLATGGSIGTAIATVDLYEKFNINQTTADQTVTIPSPTLSTNKKLIYVENVGSSSFSLYDIDLKPLSIRILVFNGAAWITAGGSEDKNKADKILKSLDVADLATGGSIGTATTTVDIYEQININQITADQTITIPNPTLTTNEKQMTVANTGSESFNIFDIDLLAGTFIECIFHSTKGWIQPSASMEIFEGASASDNGDAGLVPAPPAGSEDKFLRGSGIFDNIAAVALPEYARPIFGESMVFEDVTDAVSAGVLTYQSGSTTSLWNGAIALQSTYSNTPSSAGHIITVPAGYNTIWIRVIGNRNSAFEVDRFDGANYVTFGRRQYFRTGGIARTVSPYGVAAGPNIDRSFHNSWLMFNCPDSFGGQYKIRATSYTPAGSQASSSYGHYISGLVISKNDTGFAYTTSIEQDWNTHKVVTPLLNGASWSSPPSTYTSFDTNSDSYNLSITNQSVDISLPQCANGKEKLFFMSLHTDSQYSAPFRAWVNNIEIFSQDLSGGKYLRYLNMNNSPAFDVYAQLLRGAPRLIGFRIPAYIMGMSPFVHLKLDWTGAVQTSYYQDCGTIDIEQ